MITKIATILLLAFGTKYIPISVDSVRSDPKTRNEQLWDTCEIKPSQIFRIDKAIALYKENEKIYKKIERLRRGGVPAPVIFCFHGRESTWNFGRHLHEGSTLRKRTRYVPKGRPKRGNPPFTFLASSEDALYFYKDLESVDWSDLETAVHNIEKWNGMGYFQYHKDVNTPFNWAGTNHYDRGKYSYDGHFDKNLRDKQLGCCAILKRMQERGINIGFS
jgi:lysozyme family protein